MPPLIHLNDEDTLDLADFERTGLRIGIFGSSGAGKGWLLGRILEDLIAADIPTIMLDAESELWTFKEVGALVIGGPHGDAPFVADARQIEDVIRFNMAERVPVVFDLIDIAEAREAEAARLGELVMSVLWRVKDKDRRRSAFACTEAAIFAPQQVPAGQQRPEMLRQFAQRGRKRGLIPCVETQRVADIQKSVISQCNSQFMGYLNKLIDYNPLKAELGGRSFEHMRALPQGTFYSTYHDREIAIGPRRVTHGGGTPAESGETVTIRETERRKLGDVIAALKSAASEQESTPEAQETRPAARQRARGAQSTTDTEQAREATRQRDEAREAAAALEAEVARQREVAERRMDEIRRLEADAGEHEHLLAAVGQLRSALEVLIGRPVANIVMPDGTTAETFNTASVTEDRVLDLIRQHGGSNGAAPVLPVEKLRRGFMEQAAQRLYERMRGLEPMQRRVVEYLLTQERGVYVADIADALTGARSGGQHGTVATAVATLEKAGLVLTTDGRRKRERLSDWVREGLAAHAPTDEDVGEVLNRALAIGLSNARS